MTETGTSLTVARDGQETTIDADEVLIATGRTPNIEGLGLAEHGIAISPKGGLVVDDRMRASRSGIYAAGDVTGRDQFVYMAAYGAKLATRTPSMATACATTTAPCRRSCSPVRKWRASA
jgi:mercuric reductase